MVLYAADGATADENVAQIAEFARPTRTNPAICPTFSKQENSMSTAIWWIRRDLRLADNLALAAAQAQAEHVIPVFVLDPALLVSPNIGEKRLAFLYDGLRSLDADLRDAAAG